MTAYIVRRLIAVPFLLLGMSMILFALLWLRPGSAAFSSVGSIGNVGNAVSVFEARLGLNRPWYVQYSDWLWSAVRGDLGTSLIPPQNSVSSQIGERIGNTIEIGVLSIIIGAVIGIPTGILAAVKRNSVLDYALRFVTIAGISIPGFWTATLLLTLPAIWWGWTPISREYVTFTDDPLSNLSSVIWPALIIAYGQAAYTARLVRTSMLDVFYTDYIRTARAKGLAERVVVLQHAFRNSLITLVTVIGLQFATILGGSVIVEQIFAVPGLGSLTFQAVLLQDYPLLLGSVMMFSLVFVFISLLADILYTFVDPRIRY